MSVKVLKFGAEWCPPCKMLAPIIEELAKEMPEVEFVIVDTDEEPELARIYSVSALPTIVILKDDKQCDVLVGLHKAQQIKEKILEHC